MNYPYDPERDGPHSAVVAVIQQHNLDGLRPDEDKIAQAAPHYAESSIEDAIAHLTRTGEIHETTGGYALTDTRTLRRLHGDDGTVLG